MRLRTLDADGTRAYLNEIRPRMLAIHIRAEKIHIRWWMPAWAIEEPLRFLLRLLPIVRGAAPAATKRLLMRMRIAVDADAVDTDTSDLWRAIDELFSEADRDLLALPDDVPFVDVTTDEVRVYVGQVRI